MNYYPPLISVPVTFMLAMFLSRNDEFSDTHRDS